MSPPALRYLPPLPSLLHPHAPASKHQRVYTSHCHTPPPTCHVPRACLLQRARSLKAQRPSHAYGALVRMLPSSDPPFPSAPRAPFPCHRMTKTTTTTTTGLFSSSALRHQWTRGPQPCARGGRRTGRTRAAQGRRRGRERGSSSSSKRRERRERRLPRQTSGGNGRARLRAPTPTSSRPATKTLMRESSWCVLPVHNPTTTYLSFFSLFFSCAFLSLICDALCHRDAKARPFVPACRQPLSSTRGQSFRGFAVWRCRCSAAWSLGYPGDVGADAGAAQ